jgi:hypothetical protein
MRAMPVRSVLIAIAALVACAYSPQALPQTNLPDFEPDMLWQEPNDLATRDLFYGPGGKDLAPPATGATYQFVAYKASGTNPGYDVRDSSGRVWSVKLGIEAQPEVTVSRILWAIGFHQPPTYFVHAFKLTGMDAGVKEAARFRTEVRGYKAGGEWSWYDNAFKNTKAFKGLLVAQLMLNNWDLKTPNNRVYEAIDAFVRPRRLYMVRDVGASLGGAKQAPIFNMLGTPGSQGSKNDVDDFVAQGFIKKADGDKVTFDYRGLNQALVDTITVPDVIWTCELMSRISDEQWKAAFNAGAYPQDHADRFIAKIKEKIAQGLALKTGTR